MLIKLASLHLAIVLTAGVVSAQTPAPIVVQAATQINATSPQAQPLQPVSASSGALKTLQELKTANEEILTKQQKTLQQLDELQKAAEQLKIYTKRG